MTMFLKCKGRLSETPLDFRQTTVGEVVTFSVYGCYNGKELNPQTNKYEAVYQTVRVSVLKEKIKFQLQDLKFQPHAEVIVEGQQSVSMNYSDKTNKWYKNVNIDFANTVDIFVTALPDSIKQRIANSNQGKGNKNSNYNNQSYNNQSQSYPVEHNSMLEEHADDDFSTLSSDDIPF